MGDYIRGKFSGTLKCSREASGNYDDLSNEAKFIFDKLMVK